MDQQLAEALLEHRSRNLEKALELYQKLLIASPKNSELLHLLGILKAQQNDFKAAEKFITEALAENPNSAAINNSMGNVYKNLKEYDKAIIYYHQALRLNPNYAIAYNNLGNVYSMLDQLENANTEYQKAIKLKPDYADAYYNLALIYAKTKRLDEAIKNLEITLQLAANHVEAHCCLARLLHEKGSINEAIKHYQKTLRLDRNHFEAHNNLGAIFLAKGKFSHATEHFKKALILDPFNVEAFNNLGSLFLMQNEFEAALKYFLRLSQLVQDFDVYYNLGVIYMHMGRNNDAIYYLNEALSLKPNDVPAHVNLGAIYLKQEKLGEALIQYEFCLVQEPHNKEMQFIIDALKQTNKSTKAPNEYIQNLFDHYASFFEKHLAALKYKAPQFIYDAVIAVLGINSASPQGFTILDLGCGTGLVGEKFKTPASKLIGIDLSPKMIALAKKKNIYDELVVANIEEALENYSNINLIIASDTLVYFGDLSKILALVKRSLMPNGIFAFTLEKTSEYPFILQHNARFAHTEKYIRELAIQNALTITTQKEVIIRSQRGAPVTSLLYVMQK